MAERRGHIPVYLPDTTIVGTAVVNVESGTAVIKVQLDNILHAELIQESLVGLALVYIERDAVEEVLKEEKN